MPFNGSGTFVPLAAPDFPAVAGSLIEALRFNNNLLDVFNEGLSKCITRGGQSPATGNLPMAGFRHTGAGDPVSASDYATWGKTVGLRGAIGVSDWDTLLTTGVFEASAVSLASPSTNFPPTSKVGQLLVAAQGAVITHLYIHSEGIATRSKISSTWSAWAPLEFISTNTTLNVPGTYATIQAAMDALINKVILAGAIVTIKVADGTHTLTATTTLNHRDGVRIKLEGNLTTPANCILRTTGGDPGFHLLQIHSGHRFGSIAGFDIANDLQAPGTSTVSAIRVASGSTLDDVTKVTIRKWGRPIHVTQQSRITLNSSVAIIGGRNYGVYVQSGSHADIFDCVVSGISNTTLGSGVWIDEASTANIGYMSATTCEIAGLQISKTSRANVSGGCVFNSNTGHGVYATSGSLASIGSNVTANLNGGSGYVSELGSVLFLDNLIGDNNTQNGIFALDGGIIVSASCFFRNNSQYGVRTLNAPSPVLFSTTITGNVVGNESDVLTVYNAPTGAEINSLPNKDVYINPLGTGVVKFGAHSAIAAETVTGYITIKDEGGTLRKLAVVS